MTTCLRKSCSFSPLCITFLNVYQFMCVLFTLWYCGWDVGFDCVYSLPFLSIDFALQFLNIMKKKISHAEKNKFASLTGVMIHVKYTREYE